MNPKVSPRAAHILDFIAKPESGGNYLAYYGHGASTAPLPATLAEVLGFQSDLVKVHHAASSAVGRYQFMPSTLTSLMAAYKFPADIAFSNDFQDTLACALLERRGYSKWVDGAISSDTFADNLSMEWASLPYHTGKSYYDGDGLNHSLVSRAALMAMLAEAAQLSNDPGLSQAVPAPQPARVPVPGPLAAPPIAQPPSGPSPAPASVSHPATDKQGFSMGNIISSILTGLHFSTGGLGTLITVAEQAPQLIDAVETIAGKASDFVPSAKAVWTDLTKIVSDAEAGKWTDEPADVVALSGHIQAAWSKGTLTAKDVAATISKVTQPAA